MKDKTEVFDKEVKPLVEELKKLCYKRKIPMFMAFAISENSKMTRYKNEILTTAQMRMNPLKDDRISHFVRVIKGYKTIAPEDEMEDIQIV